MRALAGIVKVSMKYMKLTDKQLRQVNAQVKRLISSDSYFGALYRAAGIRGVASQEEFEALPFSDKGALREAYPMGICAVPEEEVVRIHSSSGTTGKPVIIPYTAKDVTDWGEMFARCYATAGVTRADRVQIAVAYGLWTAGSGFQAGAERLGAMTVPTGPGNTDKQLRMMQDMGTTVLAATSSYALLLAEEVQRRGIRDKLALKKGIFGSERWSRKMRDAISGGLGIEMYDIYGLTEIYGPGIGISCAADQGIHYWDDYIYIEVVDPVTGRPVPDGETGELVITTLVKEGAPLLRFRTHDISSIIPGKCPCGLDYPRIDVIHGRSDDMFKVHGVNMFPRQVEEILQQVDGVLSEYHIDIARDEMGKDCMTLSVETAEGVALDSVARHVRELFKSRIGMTPIINLVPHGALARSEKKTGRVSDMRD